MEISTKGNVAHAPKQSAYMSSISPVVKQRSLLLKHEILSPECDLFRACLPRRLFLRRLGRLMTVVVGMGVGHWWFSVRKLWLSLLMIISTLFLIFFMLSQTIEGIKFPILQL